MDAVYIVLGNQGVGKSTCIRALTGAYKRGFMLVRLTNDRDIEVFVQVRALQEAPFRPEDFIEEMNGKNVDYILTALHISGRSGNTCSDFVNAFQNAWPDVQLVIQVLGQENPPPEIQNIALHRIANSRNLAPNSLANQVRPRFGWV
jgi:energy-coupling factor transporter ATP-binding protein EcfA2